MLSRNLTWATLKGKFFIVYCKIIYNVAKRSEHKVFSSPIFSYITFYLRCFSSSCLCTYRSGGKSCQYFWRCSRTDCGWLQCFLYILSFRRRHSMALPLRRQGLKIFQRYVKKVLGFKNFKSRRPLLKEGFDLVTVEIPYQFTSVRLNDCNSLLPFLRR